MLTRVTPVILTMNEACNIDRTLAPLSWASDIVVVDSGSTDGTLERLESYPAVRVFHRKFDSHSAQWNFAVSETGIKTEWVLALDADYVLTAAGVGEISALQPDADIAGYVATFRFQVLGRALRGTLYPPSTVLFRKALGTYVQDGHTQRLHVDGKTALLKESIGHDDRKPLSQWIASQDRYMRLEAAKLSNTPAGELNFADRVRRMIFIAPMLVFVYVLVGKLVIMDGAPGIFYAMQRFVAEAILSLHLLARRLGAND